ncbi:hypothetical protein DDZ18_04530 [Marinicauda salina]|uniref:Tetratricopeptide repeat protein n=2 Tax=Marinicauda salina TaxID=2135793 RepID=A0A2U2BXY1_9PROT|nr:hypothetical protein DDZ18_04530 [Marinicauda salina]
MTNEPGLDRPAAAHRARVHAEAALAIDDALADAHLRLAAALGFQGRFTSPLMAYLRGLPQRGRDHIATAIRLDPDDPWGHAMLGAWHLEVVRRGGEGTLGASLDEGLARYEAAVRMAADEPGIPYHFALALIAADPDAYGERAEALLERAIAAEPEDAFAEAMIDQARSLLSLLRDDPVAAQAHAIDRLER